MKRLLLLLSFISLVAPASAGIVIKFAEKITQGSLQSVNLIVDEESFTKLDSFKLRA